MSQPTTFELIPAENARLNALCGQLNCHIKTIENSLQVKIAHRRNQFSIRNANNAPAEAASHAIAIVKKLYAMTGQNHTITANDVHLALFAAKQTDEAETTDAKTDADAETGTEAIVFRLRNHLIQGHNPRQRAYLQNILNYDINFGIGPAGTGKTYLAVASAVHALAENTIARILLVRPAVEAGEKLGFLPGDIEQKIDPYLRPLFDALYEMLGFDRVGRLLARGTIELAPLAYMRGRTLNESFVILDEAQNATAEQMQMFLTRIGFGSKAIVTGDVTQIDLAKGQRCGLTHAQTILAGIDGISFTHFQPQDVVRHPLVQRIVAAYAANSDEQAGAANACR